MIFVPMPVQDALTTERRHVTLPWLVWLQALATRQTQSAWRPVDPIVLTSQAAAIPTTSVGAVPAGELFRVSYYVRIAVPAGTASSVQVTIGWTDDSVACQASGPAVTGNTVSSTGTGSFLVRRQGQTPITYATSYSSTPAGMRYVLALVVERVG